MGMGMGVRLVVVSNVEEEASGITFSQDPGAGGGEVVAHF